MTIAPQMLWLFAVLMVLIAAYAAYFSYRMFALNRQLLISVTNVLSKHKNDIEALEEVWKKLNDDHKQVMQFVGKPPAEERPLPEPVVNEK